MFLASRLTSPHVLRPAFGSGEDWADEEADSACRLQGVRAMTLEGAGAGIRGVCNRCTTPAAKNPVLEIGRPLSKIVHRYAPALDVVFTLFRRWE